MADNMIFKRYELKYFLTKQQYTCLLTVMNEHMTMDKYKRHTINNIYLDTKDFLLIRRSLEKPCYKEKLRVRSYGDFSKNNPVFVEMKKKYKGVVYKRRLNLNATEAFDFLLHSKPLQNECQIGRELRYFMNYYDSLVPAMALSYEREAFFGIEDSDFRMTFDHNIRICTENLQTLEERQYTNVLNDDRVLLEIKTAMGIPTWLLTFFGEHHIYKTSFSKYGTAYQKFVLPKIKETKGGFTHVA